MAKSKTPPEPAAPAATATRPSDSISDPGSANAPFIYFETAPVSGYHHGIIRVTLEAARVMNAQGEGVFVDRVLVGHLRMSVPAAQSLRDAIDRALLMAKPAPTEARN